MNDDQLFNKDPANKSKAGRDKDGNTCSRYISSIGLTLNEAEATTESREA